MIFVLHNKSLCLENACPVATEIINNTTGGLVVIFAPVKKEKARKFGYWVYIDASL